VAQENIDARTLWDMLERGVAAEQLRRQGHEAFSLEGGLEAWKGF
jgi:rhodanese-related sulfurtransferase